jgi:hypothetical protein
MFIDPYGIAEWDLHGVSSRIEELPINASGAYQTKVTLDFHVSRKAAYYFWKALLPLYLLTVLSFSTFEFECDNLSDRNATVATYFLAAFAMLYVVGSALPKTDFLTKIDKVIILTTVSLACVGLAARYLSRVFNNHGVEVANTWNTIIEVGLVATYFISNCIIFLPAWWSQRSTIQKLQSFEYDKQETDNPIANAQHRTPLPPTVREGFDYATVKFLATL